MKSIYITDLDHTFLRSDQTLSTYSQEIWNTKSQDSILSIATARSYNKSLEFLSGFNLNAPLILLDGSMVVSPQKKLIDLKLINKALGDAVIEVGKQFDIYPFIIALRDMQLGESFLFPSQLNWHQNRVLENYHNDPRMQECPNIRAMEMNLKLVYFGEYELLSSLTNRLMQTFGRELEYKLAPEKYSKGHFLTILHPQGDKAHALEKVAEYLGCKMSNITVFGDSINDLGMFERAGTAVAVQNALDEVKAKADIILPYTNDEDAVAKFLAEAQ